MMRFLPNPPQLSLPGARSLLAQSLTLLTVSGLFLAGGSFAHQAIAQSAGSGFTLSGAADPDRVLSYTLDFGGYIRRLERYRLSLPAQDVAVAEVQVNFEQKFDGNVNPDNIRLEVEGEPVDIDEVFWSEEFNSLEVVLVEPIAAGQTMKLILSGARNPRDPGFYRIQGRVLGTEANPIFRYVGEWIVSIDRQSSRRF